MTSYFVFPRAICNSGTSAFAFWVPPCHPCIRSLPAPEVTARQCRGEGWQQGERHRGASRYNAGFAWSSSRSAHRCVLQQDTSTRSRRCHHRVAGDSHMVQGVLPRCSVGERGFPTWALSLHADRRGLFLFSLCSNSPIFLTVAGFPFTAGQEIVR